MAVHACWRREFHSNGVACCSAMAYLTCCHRLPPACLKLDHPISARCFRAPGTGCVRQLSGWQQAPLAIWCVYPLHETWYHHTRCPWYNSVYLRRRRVDVRFGTPQCHEPRDCSAGVQQVRAGSVQTELQPDLVPQFNRHVIPQKPSAQMV